MLRYFKGHVCTAQQEQEVGHCLRAAHLSPYFAVHVVPHVSWLHQGQERLWRTVMLHK